MSQTKTAISIDTDIFKEMNLSARETHVSRSHLFEIAAAEWLRKEKQKKIIEQINKAVEKDEVSAQEKRHLDAMRRHQRKLVEGEW